MAARSSSLAALARTGAGSSKAVLLGAGVVAAATLYPYQRALADEKRDAGQIAADPKARLSIYDTPSQPIVLVAQPPSALQHQVSSIRKTSEQLYASSRANLRAVSDNWVGAERKIEHEFKAIIPSDEPLTPGALYVGVSALLGSILTRNRIFPLRFLAPPVFLIASANYFLPKTSQNAALYIRELERAYAPSVYNAHTAVSTQVQELVAGAQRAYGKSTNAAAHFSQESREQLQKTSGLSLQSSRRTESEKETPPRSRLV